MILPARMVFSLVRGVFPIGLAGCGRGWESRPPLVFDPRPTHYEACAIILPTG